MGLNKTIEDFVGAVRSAEEKRTHAYDTPAQVVRIEDGTAWVHIPGGVDETPVKLTINAKVGDVVQIRVGGGGAWITGNVTSPPTDNTAVAELAEAVDNRYGETLRIIESETDARRTLIREYGNGVLVCRTGSTVGALVNADGSFRVIGVEWVDGVPTDNGNVLASFGEESTVGPTDSSHVYIDSNSFRMRDFEGNDYVYMSDLRDAQGELACTETFEGDGTTTSFYVAIGSNTITSVTVDGVETSYTKSGDRQIIFASAPADGAEIIVEYVTTSEYAKAYTFGTRAAGGIGSMSFVEGHDNIASGMNSHAEGRYNEAYGIDAHVEGNSNQAGSYAHAEGYGTQAGNYSHTEGYGTEAPGQMSHAEGRESQAIKHYSHTQNLGTIANRRSQTAMGEYNKADTYGIASGRGRYALIIGNGSSDSARSNAFGFTWLGDAHMKLDTTASSGTMDANLYDAITALGWESDVILNI